jgi:hypothetical protein
MWRVEALGAPAIHLYKHIDSRRYINLDDAGHAYAFVRLVPSRERAGPAALYRPCRDLIAALSGVMPRELGPPAPASRSSRRGR